MTINSLKHLYHWKQWSEENAYALTFNQQNLKIYNWFKLPTLKATKKSSKVKKMKIQGRKGYMYTKINEVENRKIVDKIHESKFWYVK